MKAPSQTVMDPWSDSFLETNVPLLELIETAKGGNEKELKVGAQVSGNMPINFLRPSTGLFHFKQ